MADRDEKKRLSPGVMGTFIGAMAGAAGMMICGALGYTAVADWLLVGGLALGVVIGLGLERLSARKQDDD